jgi:hypothetical protein
MLDCILILVLVYSMITQAFEMIPLRQSVLPGGVTGKHPDHDGKDGISHGVVSMNMPPLGRLAYPREKDTTTPSLTATA